MPCYGDMVRQPCPVLRCAVPTAAWHVLQSLVLLVTFDPDRLPQTQPSEQSLWISCSNVSSHIA